MTGCIIIKENGVLLILADGKYAELEERLELLSVLLDSEDSQIKLFEVTDDELNAYKEDIGLLEKRFSIEFD